MSPCDGGGRLGRVPHHAGQVDGGARLDEQLRTARDRRLWLCEVRRGW